MSIVVHKIAVGTQGKYHEAEELYGQSLAIREQMLGADHPDVAVSLNNMARLLATQVRSGRVVIPAPNYSTLNRVSFGKIVKAFVRWSLCVDIPLS